MGALLACGMLLHAVRVRAEPIPVRHLEGESHGFLVLQTVEGRAVAIGDWVEVGTCSRMTLHLVFHFNDGSIYDETTVFSQRRAFRLLSDHLIEKGSSFKQPVETWIDGATGQFKARYTDKDGKQKFLSQKIDLPTDVANGLVPIILKDIDPKAVQTTVSMVAATPKPRIVHLIITPRGEQPFFINTSQHAAIHYVIKVDIGGTAGVVAPLVGKQPANSDAWVLGGSAPALVREQGPLYEDGPVWTIMPIAPKWSK
ncbi:MAG: hypothetical protein WA876_16795 [Candidatus Acidiferrales bacterium]